MSKKSGFITLIGKPNVGKSSLLNALLDEKIAIVSPKVQTTRNRIIGVLTEDDTQYIFTDTPGIHTGYNLLGKSMDNSIKGSLYDVDVILYVVDRKFHKSDENILNRIKTLKSKIILVINKIDLLSNNEEIDNIILSFLPHYDFDAVVPISVLNKKHLNHLKDAIKQYLSDDIFYFDDKYKTDQSDVIRISELIRERLLLHLDDEIPHGIAVVIENIKKENDSISEVDALIVVERESQKGIVIGAQGSLLKKIKEESRRSINKTLNVKITLNLWVKVKKDWRNQANDIKRFGYGDF